MNLDPIVQAQINGRLMRACVFMRIASDDVVRAWTGMGDFRMPADSIETTGGIYKGVGILGDIPILEQLVNGTAQRIDVSVSGVSKEVADLADGDAPLIRGRMANFAIGFLKEDWSLAGDPIWVWEGEIDVVKRNMNRTPEGESRSISISMGSLMTGRRRPKFANWTGPQQHLQSPTDTFCDRTILYSQGTKLAWPK